MGMRTEGLYCGGPSGGIEVEEVEGPVAAGGESMGDGEAHTTCFAMLVSCKNRKAEKLTSACDNCDFICGHIENLQIGVLATR